MNGERPIFRLSEGLVAALTRRSPVQATFAGLPGLHDGWDDYSPDACAAWDATLASFERDLARLPPSSDPFERLAARVMAEYLTQKRRGFADGDHLRDLNSIDSTFQYIVRVFEIMPYESADDIACACRRLETVERAFAGYFRTLDEGARRGLPISVRQVRAAAEQARAAAAQTGFVAALPRRAKPDVPAALAARLDAAATHARAVFADAATRLERELLPHAIDCDAVGRDRYLRSAETFLGTTVDPEATYEWGWAQVQAIEAAMRDVARTMRRDASVREVIQMLKDDPAYAARDADEFIALMRERQELALSALDGTHFAIPRAAKRIEVRVAPPGGPLGAYYVPPSEDFSRAGTVWYSLGGQTKFPLYDEVTTAYHEGFPGHHLQCSTQVALADRLSRLHRMLVFYSGHGEGWALYAEQLMHDLGYLERPEYVLGMLAAKLMRACRVVVDIGAHVGFRIPTSERFHPGEAWSYELIRAFLTERGCLEPDYAESEATRYLGWPGQAISYAVGERAIQDLRRQLEARDGAGFDQKAFHARVIGYGSVGLDLLRDLVLDDAVGATV